MTAQRLDPDFERSVNNLRSKLSKDMGFNISFAQATSIVNEMLRGTDVKFNISQMPKSKMREIKMRIKKKRSK